MIGIPNNFSLIFTVDAVLPGVSLVVKGRTARMDNGLINISFENDATVSSLFKHGKNLAANIDVEKNFYIDWNNNMTYHFQPSRLEVITKSTNRAHIMYLQDNPKFIRIEYHIIMEQGKSGFYSYLKLTNNKRHPITFGLMRVVYRFDPTIMHQITNGVQEGSPPRDSVLRKSKLVQDTTWKLADGSIYSKYDYAGYIRNTHYQGVFGHGFGAWLLSASREYHSGGPLKQDLLVHHEALILNCITADHFGTPSLTAPVGWSKLYGPWMIYVNVGADSVVKVDALRQSKVEQSLWPYNWMNDPDYPLNRASLEGKVVSPVQAMVVLSSSLKEPFDLQTLGYSYHTETEKDGSFSIDNIRPGKYKLTAYPIEGYGIGAEAEKVITISEGKNTDSLILSVPTKVKWSIGETNRRANLYRYSNERRNYIWHTLTPANLQFVIGKSNIERDWYYAQTKKGTWSIRYKDVPNRRNRILRIGLASTSINDLGFPVLAIRVNGHLVNEFSFENDHSIYRSAPQSGNFQSITLKIPANLVIAGDNVISLALNRGSVMYDSINLSE